MTLPTDATTSHRQAGFIFVAVTCAALIAGVSITLWFPRAGDETPAGGAMYLHTDLAVPDGPLVSLLAGDPDAPLVVRPGAAGHAPVTEQGFVLSALRRDQPVLAYFGKYAYRFAYVADSIEWHLAGVRLRAGDEVGRAPEFTRAGGLFYRAADTRSIRLWMDGVPASWFRVLSADACKETGVACIQIVDGETRTTVERTAIGRFEHAQANGHLTLREGDILWIGHLPLSVRMLANAAHEWELALPDDYLDRRGDRQMLGDMSFGGLVPAPTAQSGPVEIYSMTALFKGGHFPRYRWNPETEDAYQILIDEELLCVETEMRQGRPVPQIVWRDPADRGCADALTGRESPRRRTPIAASVLELYKQRLTQPLVRIANERLDRGDYATVPETLPFTFEWWPVRIGGDVVAYPIRLWGIRTLSTQSSVDASEQSGAAPAGIPSIVLKSRAGVEWTLARSQGGVREYARRDDLLGLNPLLGVRRIQDGLDEIVERVKLAPGQKAVELTIDPDLQSSQWTALRRQLGSVDLVSRGRRAYGVTAVTLDPESGDVLATLNWPAALEWETDPDQIARRAAGRMLSSRNAAMLRGESVGSVFKLLTIYAMAEAGVLDEAARSLALESCGGRPFMALETDAQLRVSFMGPRTFKDGQPGKLPTDPAAMRAGLAESTGESCNTYFALAATMLLGERPPPIRFLQHCPVDARLRRDANEPTLQEWIVCHARPSLAQRIVSEHGPLDVVLLLPPGEKLFERALAGLRRGGPAPPGFFAKATTAGFRFAFAAAPSSTPRAVVRGAPSYEGLPLRTDWFADAPGALRRVFNYPEMRSAASFFGGGEETHAGERIQVRGDRMWRDFASQAIGEGGRGSALSLAVLYAAAARDDGRTPAPRLIRQPGAKASSGPMFTVRGQNLQAIREALRAPVQAGGTGDHLIPVASGGGFGGALYGKTGTFRLRQRLSPGPSVDPGAWLTACGVVPLVPNQPLLGARLGGATDIGSARCEEDGFVVTAIHRYPEQPVQHPPLPSDAANVVTQFHTSFAAILRSPAGDPSGSTPRSLVIAVISDMPQGRRGQLAASTLAGPLLAASWRWLAQPPGASHP